MAEFCLLVMPELSEYLNIPEGYKASYVMLFGEPDIKYSRTIQPEPYSVVSVKKGEFKNINFVQKIKRQLWNNK